MSSDRSDGSRKSTKVNREKHLQLAGVVKGVHAQLRKEYRQYGNYEKVWKTHKENVNLLHEYADAMHHLATEHWTKNPESRIEWCRKTCIDFFHNGGLAKVLDKEDRKYAFNNLAPKTESSGDANSDHSKPGSQESDKTSESDSGKQDQPSSYEEQFELSMSDFSSIGHGSDVKTPSLSEHLDSLGSDIPDNGYGASPPPINPSGGATTEGPVSTDSLERAKKKVYGKYELEKYNTVTLPFRGKIRLLDVGSCFNPFFKYEEFVALGIDISPAVESVFYCDFLHLELTETLQLAPDTTDTVLNSLKSPIEKLPKECFHVVVFSLLLEYFPSTYQRWLCCQKAHQLLLVNGLLLIITPDSKAVHRNAPMIKSWKQAIESMGFVRCKYEKQEHLHCMAFRKIIKEAPEHFLVGETGPDMLYIPQDSNHVDEDYGDYFFGSAPRSEEEDCFMKQTFCELPDLDIVD